MKRLSLFTVLSLCLLSWVFLSYRYAALTGEFRIDPTSQLRLEGVTNVNTFSCNCAENFPVDTYEIVQNKADYLFRLRGTDFRLRTDNLDCGRQGINKDLRKALKSDSFPYINIEVQTIRLPEEKDYLNALEWTAIPVQTQITIAGVRRPLHLEVEAKVLEEGSYQLRSHTEINMSDFGIDPPRPMLGLIKVHDCITIYFDLKVHLMS